MRRPTLLVNAAGFWADAARDRGLKPRSLGKLRALEEELNEARLDGDERRYSPRRHVAALGEYVLRLRIDAGQHTTVESDENA